MDDLRSSPFSRLIAVRDVPEGIETPLSFEASPAECDGVAHRLEILGVRSLAAEFSLLRQKNDRLKVKGLVKARVTQSCVVSLEAFDTDLSEAIAMEFAPEAIVAAETARVSHEPAPGATLADQADPPDPIIDGQVDLGAVAVEFLALALDPYPRKPGAVFAPPAQRDDLDESPFRALQGLRLDKDGK